jgi:uncharacterized protein YlxP (DUF503 family)
VPVRDLNYTRSVHIGALSIELHIPGCRSLKEKRSRLKPLLARLHREFNISTAEIAGNDRHRSASVACVVVSNDARQVQRVLEKVLVWIEHNRPDLQIVDHQISVL